MLNKYNSDWFTDRAFGELNASSKMASSTAPLAAAKLKDKHDNFYWLSIFILLGTIWFALRFMIKSYVINDRYVYIYIYVCTCVCTENE